MENLTDKQITIASGPVIVEDGKVILNKHGEDKFWKFLGGKIEEYDFKDPLNSFEETCRREAMEENGFDCELLLSLKPMMIPHPGKENAWVILIHYFAKRIGEINIGSDIDEIGTFDIDMILNDEYPEENFAPNIIPVLREYASLKAKGIIDLL